MSGRDEHHPREQLSALLDGELAPDERGALEAHLRGCADCRDLLAGLRVVARAAAGEEPPPVPRGLEGRIAWRVRGAAAEARRHPARPWWRARVPLTAAATLAVFGIVAGVWWSEHGRLAAPSIEVGSRPSAPAESAVVPAQEKGKDSGTATSSAGGAERPAEVFAQPAGAPLDKREKKLDAAPRSAPPASSAENAPARAGVAGRDEDTEGRVAGGVVGGVVGGVMGGVVGVGEAASDQAAAEPPAPRPARTEPAAAYAPSVATGAKLRNVADEKSAACASLWSASPPGGWTIRSGDPRSSGEGLARLARSLGGRAIPLDVTPGAWRLEVPRERWRELAAALRDRGVAGADPAAAVPDFAACVEALVTVAP